MDDKNPLRTVLVGDFSTSIPIGLHRSQLVRSGIVHLHDPPLALKFPGVAGLGALNPVRLRASVYLARIGSKPSTCWHPFAHSEPR